MILPVHPTLTGITWTKFDSFPFIMAFFNLLIFLLSSCYFVQGTTETDGETGRNEKVSLEHILAGKYSYYVTEFNGTWISDDEFHYFDSHGNLLLHNVAAGTFENLISQKIFEEGGLLNEPMDVKLSSDRKYALISYNKIQLYRNSFQAKYFVHEIGGKIFEPVVPQNEDRKTPVENNWLLQLVKWSPRNNSLVFVYQNDIFYRPSATSRSLRVTRTGGQDIFNGITDWVYEEEMFNTFNALWFSPDGSSLAYATFNDSQVEKIQYSLYGRGNFQYPPLQTFPYPKAGTSNPVATISIVDLPTTSQPMNITENLKLTTIPELSYYIGTAVWASNSKLIVVTLNRAQNESQTVVCTKGFKNCETVFKMEEPLGWIDVNIPKVTNDGSKLIMIKSMKQVDSLSYRHIVQVDLYSGQLIPITTGTFSVDSISGWDEKNNRIFFMATGYNFFTLRAIPSQSHLYMVEGIVSGGTGGPSQNIKCLTCDSQNVNYGETRIYGFNMAVLSKNFKNFVQISSGPSAVPQITIRSAENVTEPLELWENNEELQNQIDLLNLPISQDYEIPVGNGTFRAKARLWFPPDFDQDEKYPLLVDVYGGPGSQQITDEFKIDWGTSLASSKKFIYAYIDARGSGRQSVDLMFQVHRKLGTVEIQDQITVTKWLIENVGLIDENNVGIWGWSYGGYATSKVMGTDVEGIFKCGISVAPVINWSLYDTIYTERYMGLPTPEDNLSGYNASDVCQHVENFRNKKFYLIHGTGDDNVHYQQSMILSGALESADILFRQQSYPDEDHYLENVRPHLYHSLENFLFECFSRS